MADETTTTSANDLFFASWVTSEVLDEVRPYNVSRPFFRYAGAAKSNSYDFPIQDDPGAAAASGGEGTGFSNTSLTTSKATATVGTFGMMATVTDELVAVSLVDALPHFASVLGRSVAEKYETDFCALYDDFTQQTTDTGNNADVADFIAGIAALVARDAVGQLVAVFHPVTTTDIWTNLATGLTASYAGNPSANFDGVDAANLSGYAGTLFDVPMYHTSLVPTANAGADRTGAIFVAGVALGLYELWGTRIELERDASMPGTEVVATARYGVVQIRDAWGQEFVFDA